MLVNLQMRLTHNVFLHFSIYSARWALINGQLSPSVLHENNTLRFMPVPSIVLS